MQHSDDETKGKWTARQAKKLPGANTRMLNASYMYKGVLVEIQKKMRLQGKKYTYKGGFKAMVSPRTKYGHGALVFTFPLGKNHATDTTNSC
jgi:hypothetical protein